LANGANKDVPRMMVEADTALHFHKPSKEVETFIEHCNRLVGLMTNMAARSRD